MVWFSSLPQYITVSELAKHGFESRVKHANMDVEPVLRYEKKYKIFKDKNWNYSKLSVIYKLITCSIPVCHKCYHFKAVTWNYLADVHKSIYIWSYTGKIQTWSSWVFNFTINQELSFVCAVMPFIFCVCYFIERSKIFYMLSERIWRQS